MNTTNRKIDDLAFRYQFCETTLLLNINRLEQILELPDPTTETLLAAIKGLKEDTEDSLTELQVAAVMRLGHMTGESADILTFATSDKLPRPTPVPA